MSRRDISIEGLTPNEILALPEEELDVLVFCDQPLAFRAGSAEILGEFRRSPDRMTLELAHIDGGGEGVLPSMGAIARRYATRAGIPEVEWLVHAVHCATPNLKLRAVLDRRGFEIQNLPGTGACIAIAEPMDKMSQSSFPFDSPQRLRVPQDRPAVVQALNCSTSGPRGGTPHRLTPLLRP